MTLTFRCCVITMALLAFRSLGADERPPKVETLQPGVRLSLVAEHPALATPTGIDVDAAGRIWVVATHTHFRPDDYVGPEHDEVLVFSDSDGDGRTETRQVFYNATTATMDLELGADGWVYLAERDRVVRIRDTDGDGAADVEEDMVALTTEADYPHNGLEGLAWHPDGTLVFGLGENFAKPWTLKGRDGVSLSGSGEGGIFGCTADGQGLRRIAHGFWNPFGICVRSDGELFAAENDPGEQPPCRLLHIIDGGDYGYQRAYGSEAHHPFVGWNGELRGTLPMIHPSGEAPCGVLPLGNGLLVPSWSDHRIDFFRLQRAGASFRADRLPLVQGGRYFRPSCIAADPSARETTRAWYLSDWVDGRYEAHGFGRLWKLEIDLSSADWVGPLELEPPTDQARLAAGLRRGDILRDRESLVEISRDEDPFLARSALLALARDARSWTPAEVGQLSDVDRVQATLALHLAEAPPDIWIPRLLADRSADVQFETLRWIADGRFVEFLPLVESMLTRSDLDYARFEAAVATWNVLSGQPEAGIRNPALLLARVRDVDSPPQVRAFALRLLPTQPMSARPDGEAPVTTLPEGLTQELLAELLNAGNDVLEIEVVRTLAGNPLESQELLFQVAVDPARRPLVRAEALAGLAAVADAHEETFLQLAGDGNRAVREEALRGLRVREWSADQRARLQGVVERYPESADAVGVVLDRAATGSGRPPVTDTQAWLERLASVAGPPDRESGRRIFHHAKVGLCANCHRHSGRGNVVGPDLSRLGQRQDRGWLLRSILEPSREMSPEYQPRTVLLNNGQTFTGIRLRSWTRETLRDAHGQNRTFDRDEIDSWVESPVSFMPAGLVEALTDREVRDLLAFLEAPPETP